MAGLAIKDGQVAAIDEFNAADYAASKSTFEQRQRTEQDIQTLVSAINNGTVDELLYGSGGVVSSYEKGKLVSKYKNPALFDDSQWQAIIDAMQNEDARAFMNNLLNGKEYTPEQYDAFMRTSDFLNTLTPETKYQMLESRFGQAFNDDTLLSKMAIGTGNGGLTNEQWASFTPDDFTNPYLRSGISSVEGGSEWLTSIGA